MNLLALNNRVKFTLSTKNFGSIEIDEPIGWNKDDKEFTRNEDYHGIFINMSNNLSFIGNAYDFLDMIYAIDGIIAEVRLTKEERHPITDNWVQSYSGYLDFTTYQNENNQIKLKFNSGGLESMFKTRETENIEISRNDTLNGTLLPPIETVNLNLLGRNIFLESVWDVVPMNYEEEIFVWSEAGNTRTTTTTFPLELVKKSHEQASSTFLSSAGTFENGVSTMMLLNNLDRKRIFKLKISDLKLSAYTTKNQTNWAEGVISIIRTNNGTNYNIIERTSLWIAKGDNVQPPIFGNNYGTITINEELIFELNQNESLGIEIMVRADLKNGRGSRRYANMIFKMLEGKITIQEDSYFDPTLVKALKPFDLMNRLLTIYTNRENVLKSEVLSIGKWKDLLISHGFWIRGFSKEVDDTLPEEDRKFKPLTTNARDFINSFITVANLGLGIERSGYEEKIVIENLSYFYNQNVTIKLPNPVKKLKRSVDVNKYYKSVEIGFEKGGEYEEAMGLDEFNVKNTYTTVISNVKNTYSKISKYRADSYGSEFARRKNYDLYPNEDTSYDLDIFLFDSKNIVNNNYTVRLWNDDFNQIPTGIYSPETAFNLRLSPFNSMLRHGWVLSSNFIRYPNESVKYASSNGNSLLKTLYSENGSIMNINLDRARFVPEIVEFDHIVDIEISNLLSGKKNINGVDIPNVYGLIEYEYEGKIERGFLLTVKPNGEGKWKLLKSNR